MGFCWIQVLSDGTVWLPYLVEKIVEVATNGSKPILIKKKLIEGPDANQWGKRWIPLFLAFQVFLNNFFSCDKYKPVLFS